jgi:hypothetical protein
MNIFLRAKHWQLFLLTFGIPMLLDFVMIFSIVFKIAHNQDLMHNQNPEIDPSVMLDFFKFFPVIMLLFMGTLLGWQWSVAMGLQKMVPPGIKMKVTKFKIFFFIPVIYMTLILGFISFFFSGFFFNHHPNPELPGPEFFMGFAVIFPLHLFSMFCLFYCIYFVSKTIKTVEMQREVSFSDFVAEFFLIWFFPIGVWFIQPRINKMIKEYTGPGGEPVQE